MKKSEFATKLGFLDFNALLDASREMYQEGDISWFITELPEGQWAAWDDAEIDTARVETFCSRVEAEDHQVFGLAKRRWMRSLPSA